MSKTDDSPHEDQRDVFISYSRKDEERVEKLIADLAQRGVSVWRDKVDIRPTEDWAEALVRAIKTSRVFLFAASQGSFTSDNTADELNLAKSHKKPILQVRLEPVDVPDKYALHLGRPQWVDLYGEHEAEGLEKILAGLRIQGARNDGRGGAVEPKKATSAARSLWPPRRAVLMAACALAVVAASGWLAVRAFEKTPDGSAPVVERGSGVSILVRYPDSQPFVPGGVWVVSRLDSDEPELRITGSDETRDLMLAAPDVEFSAEQLEACGWRGWEETQHEENVEFEVGEQLLIELVFENRADRQSRFVPLARQWTVKSQPAVNVVTLEKPPK